MCQNILAGSKVHHNTLMNGNIIVINEGVKLKRCFWGLVTCKSQIGGGGGAGFLKLIEYIVFINVAGILIYVHK